MLNTGGFLGGTSGKELAWQMQVMQIQSLGQEDPWRRARQPTPIFLSGETHGQRSLVGHTP